jgi:phosphoribosylformylglycinamidine (FGAM) synthase PurS component
MTYRLEIRLRDGLLDASGTGISKKSKAYFGYAVEDVRVIRVLTIDAHFDAQQRLRIQRELFTNPITEESSYTPIQKDFDWLIWVGFRPGVRDTAGSTAREAIEDLLGVTFNPRRRSIPPNVMKSAGISPKDQVHRIAAELLANGAIQQWKIFFQGRTGTGKGASDFLIPKVILSHEPEVQTLSIESDEALKCISMERNLALQDRDIPVIREYFLREDVLKERETVGLDLPTDVELEYISQARSDHCNHNTFRGSFITTIFKAVKHETIDSLFKTCIEAPTLKIQGEKDWVVSVLWDNAGVGRFDSTIIITASPAKPTTAPPIWKPTAGPLPESWGFTGIPWAPERARS